MQQLIVPAIPGIQPELVQEWQYVQSSKGGGPGYWRRRSRHGPSRAQAAQRLRMSELSHRMYGATGTAQLRDGRRIPVNAVLVSPLLRGSPKI
ncbi:MAG: hypothetical protein KKI06_10530 [Euryarchaeota archaeon]|nr:hypothetical protein [Euryarchaeota archaeon]